MGKIGKTYNLLRIVQGLPPISRLDDEDTTQQLEGLKYFGGSTLVTNEYKKKIQDIGKTYELMRMITGGR